MSPPTVRVNTFVAENEKPHVDSISQMFIVLQVMFGLDRLPLIGKGKFVYVFLTFVYCLILNAAVTFSTLYTCIQPVNLITSTTMTCNIIIALLSFLRCKWMQKYYSELNKFDEDASCRPKIPLSSIWNAVCAGLMCVFIILVFEVPQQFGLLGYSPQQFMPLFFIYVLEVFYFGHLLSLLTPRMKLINYYMGCSLSSTLSEPISLQKEFIYLKSYNANKDKYQMSKLMDLYEIAVEAYDFLIEGIKWQLLVVIISAFITVLGYLYIYSMKAIHTSEIMTEGCITYLGVSLTIMIPLFVPCTFSDRLHNEVRKLRELLASRLYENQLDKSSRRVARALLAFSETRDLSFRLLRMLNIDISLPFKFLGLLVTYLIILLQFEKVINP